MSSSSGNQTDKQILGKRGEDAACTFLESKEIRILERNYHFMKAEIDIVAYNGRQIIFAEVKTRSNTSISEPEEAVSEKKKKNMYKAAEAWLYERKMDGAPVRFDIISVVIKEGLEPRIRHFEGAFWYL